MTCRIAIGLVVLLQSWCLQALAQADTDVLLIARNTGTKVLSNSDTIRVFGFARTLSANPDVPGPTIEVNQGDSVHLDLWNVSQGAPHTIHLHGLDVDQQNDGVPHLSFEVEHMKHGFYHFKAPHAGTYLYHCHVVSAIHVQAGMYGLLIVHPSDGGNTTWDGGPEYHSETSFLFSEIDVNWHTNNVLLHAHDSTQMQIPIPHYAPQFFLVNGLSGPQITDSALQVSAQVNAVSYLRLANIGYCGNRVVFPPGLNATVIDSDGRPLPQSVQQDTLEIYPGERYGVLCTATSELMDSIRVDYLNMNTLQVTGTEYVPVQISGYLGAETLVSAEHLPLLEVHPNPFHDNGQVRLTLKKAGWVEIQVLDATGKSLGKIVSGPLSQGAFEFDLNEALPGTGIFFLRLQVDDTFVLSRKVIRW